MTYNVSDSISNALKLCVHRIMRLSFKMNFFLLPLGDNTCSGRFWTTAGCNVLEQHIETSTFLNVP